MDIAGALTGLTFIRESFTALLRGKIEAESQARVLDALERVGNVQDALFGLREDLARLQTENESLRARLGALDEWRSVATKYQLVQTAGGGFVYASSGPPPHFACPKCFNEAKQIQVLQPAGEWASCPACRMAFEVSRSTRSSPRESSDPWA
jgi:hypothetical protein